MDIDHPFVTGTGMFFADMFDITGDKTDEFIIGYADKSGSNIEYNISCYEYNPNNVIQGANNPMAASAGVEMNSTLTVFSEADFTSGSSSHIPNDFQVYTVEGKDKNYLFVEHVTDGSWECKVYTVTAGNFSEFDTLKAKSVSEKNTEKAKKFFEKYKIKKAKIVDDKDYFCLTKQDKDSLVFTYSYSQKSDDEQGVEEEYIINDYTDILSLLNPQNRAETEKAIKRNEEAGKKKNTSKSDIRFGGVVKNGDYVYYWKYSDSAFSNEGSESANYQYRSGAENSLIRRDKDGKETVILQTAGAGNLAIAGNRIFFQKANGNSRSYNVDSCDMEGNDVTYHDTGVLEGVVQNGAYVVYSPERTRYEFGTIKAIKTEGLEKVNTVYNARFLACDNDRVYYQAQQAEYTEAHHGKTTVSSVFANGSASRTLYVTDSNLYENEDSYGKTSSLIRDAYILGDSIYYVYGSYNSSTDEFRGGNIVKAKLDGSSGEVIAQSDKDYFTVNSSGKVTEVDAKASMNGYTFVDGTVYKYNPQKGKNEEIITPDDYIQFTTEKVTDTGSSDTFVSLDFAVSCDKKVYFMIKSGKNSSDGYRFSGCALFEKDIENEKTVMLYSVTNNSSSDTEG